MLTDQQHPITPPPELMEQWREEADKQLSPYYDYITTQAARWGADQELEACVKWMLIHLHAGSSLSRQLRAARRPKPPSLAEAALEVVTSLRAGKCVHRNGGRMNVLTAALKRLQELEEGQ